MSKKITVVMVRGVFDGTRGLAKGEVVALDEGFARMLIHENRAREATDDDIEAAKKAAKKAGDKAADPTKATNADPSAASTR